MTTLIERISKDRLAARKSGDSLASSTLTTLVAEASKISAEEFKKGMTEITDGKVVKTVKAFVENARSTMAVSPEDRKEALRREIAILEAYLPKQLSEDDLRAIIFPLKANGMSMGEIMSYLKDQHEGTYDGKIASMIARS